MAECLTKKFMMKNQSSSRELAATRWSSASTKIMLFPSLTNQTIQMTLEIGVALSKIFTTKSLRNSLKK